MFLSFGQLISRLNSELERSGDLLLSEPGLYRLRKIFTELYPSSSKLSASGRMLYDEQTCLWLYFAAKLHFRLQSYRLDLIYLQGLERQLQQRGLRFSEAFSSFSTINLHFANFNQQEAS
jgi:hypothetical protein